MKNTILGGFLAACVAAAGAAPTSAEPELLGAEMEQVRVKAQAAKTAGR